MTAMAQAAADGRTEILAGRAKNGPNIRVTKGRGIYCTFENPTDFRAKWKVTKFQHCISPLGTNALILDTRCSPEELYELLSTDASANGPFAAIFIDTLQAAYDGKDANDTVAMGNFARRLRKLTELRGRPAVIVAPHPVKNAQQDNLIPYGANSLLNGVDGNLTLWRDRDGIITLHWQGKFRGPEFEPMRFKIETRRSPEVINKEGVQIGLPVMVPVTEQDAEERERANTNLDIALLKALRDNPGGTQEDWGNAIGKAKSVVNRRLGKLQNEKLVENKLGRWQITKTGLDAFKSVDKEG
jgi:hypothetical protein